MEGSDWHKFKWFLSLKRLKKGCNKENFDESTKSSSNVFYTIRRKLQKRFTSHQKVKALEENNKNHLESGNNLNRVVFEHENLKQLEFLSPIQSDQSNNQNSTVQSSVTNENQSNALEKSMADIRKELSHFGWYWGKLSRHAAQKRLNGQPDGSFLVRDSQTEHTFTLSFRSSGVTLHCRINLDEDKCWSYIENARFPSVVELIEETMRKSESAVFGFVKQNSKLQTPFPVRLTNPIIRFQEVPSLQHLTRLNIRRQVAPNNISLLPLPEMLKEYLTETSSDYFDL